MAAVTPKNTKGKDEGMDKVRFFKTERNGKIALWFNNGPINRNIWDLDKELVTVSVEKAIMHAFRLGQDSVSLACPNVDEFNNSFVEETPPKAE